MPLEQAQPQVPASLGTVRLELTCNDGTPDCMIVTHRIWVRDEDGNAINIIEGRAEEDLTEDELAAVHALLSAYRQRAAAAILPAEE